MEVFFELGNSINMILKSFKGMEKQKTIQCVFVPVPIERGTSMGIWN
jgi:hypothetical protein